MKVLIPLLILTSPLHAKLLATFETTEGNVVVELQYDKTPQTVANFITLAQATRTRIDPLTGAVIRKPLYVGETFYRVVSNDFTKIAQTGSGTGTNNGGPGYTIRDEFDSSLTHVPYVLSMANSGKPHTVGSQIFFTGNIIMPEYDNSHTIFGLVIEPSSRGVIDAIIQAGDNATTINNVTFNRTDAAAQAFDQHAQKLPICAGIAGELEVVPGSTVSYLLEASQPEGSVFQVRRSNDLMTWSQPATLYQGTGQTGSAKIIFDIATLPRAFYNLLLVTYPDALAPALLSHANRTLSVVTTGRTITSQFQDEDGILVGSVDDSNNPAGPENIESVSYVAEPYKATYVINMSNGRKLQFESVFNSETFLEIAGNCDVYEFITSWSYIGNGALTLSKP